MLFSCFESQQEYMHLATLGFINLMYDVTILPTRTMLLASAFTLFWYLQVVHGLVPLQATQW